MSGAIGLGHAALEQYPFVEAVMGLLVVFFLFTMNAGVSPAAILGAFGVSSFGGLATLAALLAVVYLFKTNAGIVGPAAFALAFLAAIGASL